MELRNNAVLAAVLSQINPFCCEVDKRVKCPSPFALPYCYIFHVTCPRATLREERGLDAISLRICGKRVWLLALNTCTFPALKK
jgi:hypothetical protein